MTSLLPGLVLSLLAVSAHAKPADIEKRHAGPSIVIPDVTLPILDASDGDDDAEMEKRELNYYYGSSSYSSIPNVKTTTPYDGPIIDHAAEGGTGKAPGCLPEYSAMPKDSTMCVYADEPSVIEYGLAPDTIQLIVDLHNNARAAEPAEDMVKMYWDDSIAVPAQKLAQSCAKAHDKTHNRNVPGYNITIGQNYCGGIKEWSTCIRKWHEEKDDWTYGEATTAKIGHFTQMVNVKAVAIGCGYAYCPNHTRQNMFCNYAYGQTRGNMKKPYAMGDKCAACPNCCVNDLCDCGKKICLNNGKLIPASCTCKCLKPFVGEACEEVDCSIQDNRVCGTSPYIATNCQKYSNLPGICPRMCSLC